MCLSDDSLLESRAENMELIKEISGNAHLYVPVVFVAVSLVLVYVFGFKRAVQPPFDKLSAGAGDERKSSGKKRKVKDKVGTVVV